MPVYFLQPTTGGPVKIGHSGDVDGRIRQLESHYGQPLALLATMPGGRDEEQAIHARFAHLRFGRTEQFRPDAELMAFIGRPLLVGANPATVEAIPKQDKIIRMKCSVEWVEWLEKAAELDRTTVAGFLDRAAADRAKTIGLTDTPPRRVP